MEKRIINPDETDYKKLEAVAKMLEAFSEHDATYVVGDVYRDFGQRKMWTTICREGYMECQILSSVDWDNIIKANSLEDLAQVTIDIKNDKYFND